MSTLTSSGNITPSAAATYTKAILDLLGERDPLAVMRDTPGQIEALGRGLVQATLVKPEALGKWSMRHVVAHLADSELVGGWRLRLILSHETPPLRGYDQDLFAAHLKYDGISFAEALADFSAVRRANLRLWTDLTPAELARFGRHAERGEESLDHMRKLYAGHDLAHLNQLKRVRAVVAGS
ncbi:MAG: DinB family protein [Gemmatimonadales bacterium]